MICSDTVLLDQIQKMSSKKYEFYLVIRLLTNFFYDYYCISLSRTQYLNPGPAEWIWVWMVVCVMSQPPWADNDNGWMISTTSSSPIMYSASSSSSFYWQVLWGRKRRFGFNQFFLRLLRNVFYISSCSLFICREINILKILWSRIESSRMYVKIFYFAVDVSQKALRLLSLDERNATSIQELSDCTCIKNWGEFQKSCPNGKDVSDVKVVDGIWRFIFDGWDG